MVATTRERIDRWLGEIFAAVGGSGEVCQVMLVHAAVDQSQRHVKTWKFDESVPDLARVVDDMDESAGADAEALGGRQRYALRAQLKGKDLGSLTLRYDITSDTGNAVDSEPATTAGVVALLQRHAEGSTRMLLQGVGTIVESLKAHIASQNELLGQFQQQAIANFRMQEELASRKTESEILLAERLHETIGQAPRRCRQKPWLGRRTRNWAQICPIRTGASIAIWDGPNVVRVTSHGRVPDEGGRQFLNYWAPAPPST
jgi:hypothetical protein